MTPSDWPLDQSIWLISWSIQYVMTPYDWPLDWSNMQSLHMISWSIQYVISSYDLMIYQLRSSDPSLDIMHSILVLSQRIWALFVWSIDRSIDRDPLTPPWHTPSLSKCVYILWPSLLCIANHVIQYPYKLPPIPRCDAMQTFQSVSLDLACTFMYPPNRPISLKSCMLRSWGIAHDSPLDLTTFDIYIGTRRKTIHGEVGKENEPIGFPQEYWSDQAPNM